MRKKRAPETAEHRGERLKDEAQARIEQASTEDKAVDAAIRQSIDRYGA